MSLRTSPFASRAFHNHGSGSGGLRGRQVHEHVSQWIRDPGWPRPLCYAIVFTSLRMLCLSSAIPPPPLMQSSFSGGIHGSARRRLNARSSLSPPAIHSDIDKNYTLKVKVQTAYKLTFEVGLFSPVVSLCLFCIPWRAHASVLFPPSYLIGNLRVWPRAWPRARHRHSRRIGCTRCPASLAHQRRSLLHFISRAFKRSKVAFSAPHSPPPLRSAQRTYVSSRSALMAAL